MQEKEKQERKIAKNFTLEDLRSLYSKGSLRRNDLSSLERRSREFWEGRSRTSLDVNKVVTEGSIEEKRALSRIYFGKSGLYRQIIMHYSTVLTYQGILIPNPPIGTSLQDKSVKRRYYNGIELVDNMNTETLFTSITQSVLVNGQYFGIIQDKSRKNVTIMELPVDFCRSNLVTPKGKNLVEFDVRFFDKRDYFEVDSVDRKSALKLFPKVISRHYHRWSNGKAKSPWILLPEDMGISFQLASRNPYFLSVIPTIEQYDLTVELEAEKGQEDIKKILVQKIDHLNDGRLLFEPIEVQEMHQATVDMLEDKNPNLSILTTYGDVDVAQSSTSDSVTHTAIDQMARHLYSSAGVSSQLFSATTASAVKYSLDFDISLMMSLARQYADLVAELVNDIIGTETYRFSYKMMALSQYNKKDFIADNFKLAQSGYSFLVPAIAQGFSQREFENLKDLENDALGLVDKMMPLRSAYTTSSSEDNGRPEKSDEEKADKTITNVDNL